MKLPNVENAIVPRRKITEYLLSSTHRDGRSKAAFFTRFGFSIEEWDVLAAALLRHARQHEITKIEGSPFGTRYVIEGTMVAPDGTTLNIRSIWFIRNGGTIPQIVSAYPLRRLR